MLSCCYHSAHTMALNIPFGIKGQFTQPVVVDGPKLDES